MSLPKYIVNIEEGLPYLIPSFSDDHRILFDEGYQRTKGLICQVENGIGKVEWVTDRPIRLSGIRISTEFANKWDMRKHNQRFGDTINFSIGNKHIIRNKPLRIQEDFLNIRNYLDVPEGIKLSFTIDTNTQIGKVVEDKFYWIDLEFLAEPVTKRYKFIGLFGATILYERFLSLSSGDFKLTPKKIDGYEPIEEFIELSPRPVYGSTLNDRLTTIEVQYRRV